MTFSPNKRLLEAYHSFPGPASSGQVDNLTRSIRVAAAHGIDPSREFRVFQGADQQQKTIFAALSKAQSRLN
jgi:hypothetical protein